MTKIIGITGLIASGKTTLVNYLKDKNYKVFDSDFEVKKLYLDKNFLNKLKEVFPDAFQQNILDKKHLAEIVFSNKEKKTELENLIHPIIEKKCDNFIKENINEEIIFLDVPLLFEVNWDKKCTDIILINIDKNIQKQRFLDRGGDSKIFDKIIQNQGNIKEKISKSNFILNNNSSLKDFYNQIDKILKNKWT
ncbi:MAG TPA: dephospho-CoA kinase [Rickettsiales bacterium]|nr:dephospho-CoA kinase [Rickettsiales bacterium]